MIKKIVGYAIGLMLGIILFSIIYSNDDSFFNTEKNIMQKSIETYIQVP